MPIPCAAVPAFLHLAAPLLGQFHSKTSEADILVAGHTLTLLLDWLSSSSAVSSCTTTASTSESFNQTSLKWMLLHDSAAHPIC